MKKILNITVLVCLGILIGIFTRCDNRHNDLNLTDQVKILNFAANGKNATIDNKKNTIDLYLPKGSDLQHLVPLIKLSPGAVCSPTSGEEVNLSTPLKYHVVNGDTYNDYLVTASIIKGQILTFSIGKYKGSIDQDAGVITLRYPRTEDITKLTPDITITDDATLTPDPAQPQDFSKPVVYTVHYRNEDFPYTVKIEQVDIKIIAFLGTADNPDKIENKDEQTAYQWLTQAMPNYEYISFSDIKNGKDLSQYAAIWWHYDEDKSDLPIEAQDPVILSTLQDYHNRGGSFFLSSWATQYAAVLGLVKNGKIVNNIWGQNNAATTISGDIGICFHGNETHPIFKGLHKPAGTNDKVFLQSSGVNCKGHNAIWSFDTWTEYPSDPVRWSSETGAVNLASFDWDNDLTQRSVLFEYPRKGNVGCTICIGNEGYDWFNENNSKPNEYKENIEILTKNILDYISYK